MDLKAVVFACFLLDFAVTGDCTFLPYPIKAILSVWPYSPKTIQLTGFILAIRPQGGRTALLALDQNICISHFKSGILL